MYNLITPPDAVIEVYNHQTVNPVVTLESDSGEGRAQIIIDDGCFVYCVQNYKEEYQAVKHWPPEVVLALSDYIKGG